MCQENIQVVDEGISKEHTKLKQSWIKQDKAMERQTTKEYERVDKAKRWLEREEAKLGEHPIQVQLGHTLIIQAPDTDLNEHVRRLYGNKECALMMEKLTDASEPAADLDIKLEREEAERGAASNAIRERSSSREEVLSSREDSRPRTPRLRHQQSQSSRPRTPQKIIDAIQESKLKEIIDAFYEQSATAVAASASAVATAVAADGAVATAVAARATADYEQPDDQSERVSVGRVQEVLQKYC